MRATTLAILALGLTTTLPVGGASAAPVTIRATGIAAGTDAIGLFGMGNDVSFEQFEVVYRFNDTAGIRQHTSIYNGNSPVPVPGSSLFEVQTHDKFLDEDTDAPSMLIDFILGGRTVSFGANRWSSAEVIDYFRRGNPSDRVVNMEAHGIAGKVPYSIFDLSQFFLQSGRLPAFGDAISGPLPETSISEAYSASGSQGTNNNHGNFRVRKCTPFVTPCVETDLKIYFSTSISIAAGSVPEAQVWGMMLLGFAATGYALRRRLPSRSVVSA